MLKNYIDGAQCLSGLEEEFKQCKELVKKAHRIVLIGCGGSFCEASHLAHDFLKVGKIKTLCPESGNLLTCLFNDYPKAQAYKEWAVVQREPDDLLIVISSSGESDVTINCAKYYKSMGNPVITVTGFSKDNKLSKVGDVNVHIPTNNYGVHELMSGCFLHAILDSIVDEKLNGPYKEFVDQGDN